MGWLTEQAEHPGIPPHGLSLQLTSPAYPWQSASTELAVCHVAPMDVWQHLDAIRATAGTGLASLQRKGGSVKAASSHLLKLGKLEGRAERRSELVGKQQSSRVTNPMPDSPGSAGTFPAHC